MNEPLSYDRWSRVISSNGVALSAVWRGGGTWPTSLREWCISGRGVNAEKLSVMGVSVCGSFVVDEWPSVI